MQGGCPEAIGKKGVIINHYINMAQNKWLDPSNYKPHKWSYNIYDMLLVLIIAGYVGL